MEARALPPKLVLSSNATPKGPLHYALPSVCWCNFPFLHARSAVAQSGLWMETPLRYFQVLGARSVVGHASAPQRAGEDRTPDLGNIMPTRRQLRSNPPKKKKQHLGIFQGARRALDIFTPSSCFLPMCFLCCIPVPFRVAALVRFSNCESRVRCTFSCWARPLLTR